MSKLAAVTHTNTVKLLTSVDASGDESLFVHSLCNKGHFTERP